MKKDIELITDLEEAKRLLLEFDEIDKKQDKEIERLKEEYIMLQNASEEYEEELQQRINKAIEYIENNEYIYQFDKGELLNILDKENNNEDNK